VAAYKIRFEAPFAQAKAEALREGLGDWLARQGFPGETAGRVITALDELFCNTMEHAGAHWVEVEVWNRGSSIAIRFADDGMPFDPSTQGRRDYAVYLQGDTDRRLGIYLISRLANALSYRRSEEGSNEIHFTVGAEAPDPFRRLKRP
jgi:anti-sigma regulatory factor (Ser/Thr protein kinase)